MNKKEIGTMPFQELLKEFIQFLKIEKSYKQFTLINYRTKLCKILKYMQNNRIDTFTPDVGMKYYEWYLIEHKLGIRYQKEMLTILNRFNDFYSGEEYVVQRKKHIDLLPEEYEQVLKSFYAKCCSNGNKENSIKKKNQILRCFIKDCIELGCISIHQLHASQVARVCLRKKSKDSWPVIRDFLKFLVINGTTEADLSFLVPHYKQIVKVSDTYTMDEISKFLDVIDRSTHIGKRDYAMLLLAIKLGMRSGDIVNLTLDNLTDINGKLFFFQQKTGVGHELPLLPEIKDALEDYINNGRPNTQDCRVFIRQQAPYQGISTSALRFATTRYFHSAGIIIEGKKHGPHTFRSSMANSMVNSEIPYDAVSKILGHSDPNAIKHYAKLNIELLRQCAIEVPAPSGNFKKFLQGGGLLC
jgi:site-specific recombinase XerD